MLCLCRSVPLLLQGLSAQARPPLNKARRAAGSRCNASKLLKYATCQRLRGPEQWLLHCCFTHFSELAGWPKKPTRPEPGRTI